ncbi:MAG: ATPase P [Ruminococcus sp.]|nr:ATPase P [Ruminococcus sp.]
MKITTAKIDGMMCPMCESHVNDAVRKNLTAKKVTSSHRKGETVIISDESITREQLEAALEGSGYKVLSVSTGEYVRKGLFHRK